MLSAIFLAGYAFELYSTGAPGDPQYPVQPGDLTAQGAGAIGLTVRSPGHVDVKYTFSNRDNGFRDLVLSLAPTPTAPPGGVVDNGTKNGDTVAVFRLYGRAQIEPESAQETFNPDTYDIRVNQMPDYQAIFVKIAEAEDYPVDFRGNRGDSIKLFVRLREPIAATENSRTVLVTPRISAINLCPTEILSEVQRNFLDEWGRRTAQESCTTPDAVDPYPSRDHWIDIEEPESFKVDFTNYPTRTPGLLSWSRDPELIADSGSDSESYVVNYVRINQESVNSRYLFLSAAFLGFAAALGPIGFELLATSHINVRRRLAAWLSNGTRDRLDVGTSRQKSAKKRSRINTGMPNTPLRRRP